MANDNNVAKVPYSIRFEKELLEWLGKQAAKENRTVTNLLETIALEYKAKNSTKPKPKKK